MSVVSDDLTRAGLSRASSQLHEAARRLGPVQLDLHQVRHVDSAGIVLLQKFVRHSRSRGTSISVHGASPAVQRALGLYPYLEHATPRPPGQVGTFEQLGAATQEAWEVTRAYAALCADLVYRVAVAARGGRSLRRQAVLREVADMGAQAVGVVGLISFLVGVTVALQSAVQLRQFGANVFVADLLGVAVTRELGPLMAAIVVAGRTGSAIAAEIATMVITEEIDALTTMGINPRQFILVPKALALALALPLLTVVANALAIFGGFLVATSYLDVGATAFAEHLQQAIGLKDLATGLCKASIFAFLIVTIGALCGLRTRGGAEAVGRSTTKSVVASIFAIVVADAVCSLLFYFGD